MIPYALMNILLAAVVGFLFDGPRGAMIGAILWSVVLVAWHVGRRPAIRHLTAEGMALGLTVAKRLLGLVFFVPVSLLGFALGLVGMARAKTEGVLPEIPAAPNLKRPAVGLGHFLASFVKGDNLAYTVANVLALIVIGCIAIGMEV
ncbi:MAG: hypothetical protein PHS60_09595, partial [Zavarzinia sp.]|nr:hypothetical protein [Zavarzinia sp.]